LFAGGALGGWFAKHYGDDMVFLACGIAMVAWLVFAMGMRVPPPRRYGEVVTTTTAAASPDKI